MVSISLYTLLQSRGHVLHYTLQHMNKNLGKFFSNSAFNLVDIPWGGALKITATNLKTTPKQMLGSCEATSIFVTFLDRKSSVHFSIVTTSATGL